MADMKGAGMLSDVSLRGVNFRFWSGLWCSGQITVIFSGKGLFQGCSERNITKLYIFNLFYLLDSCNQSLKWSLLGVKKRLAHAQIGLLWGFNSKFPTSIPTPFGSKHFSQRGNNGTLIINYMFPMTLLTLSIL